jgi:HEPN domain-containing protein
MQTFLKKLKLHYVEVLWLEDKIRGEQLVYGDFPKLLNLKVTGEIDQLGILAENLNRFDRSIFMGFTSYILAKGGFKDLTLFDDSRYGYNNERLIYEYAEDGDDTREYDEDQWVKCIGDGLTQWTEELTRLRDERGTNATVDELEHYYWWSHKYQRCESKEKLVVIFLPRLNWDLIFFQDIEDDRSPWVNIPLEGDQNFVIAKPSEYKKAKKEFPEKLLELKDVLPKMNKNASLVSVDEFVAKVLPDSEKKHVILENWITIRDRVLEGILKEYPLLILALEKNRLVQADDSIRKSRRDYEDEKFDDAIKAAAFACEAILYVYYRKNYGKIPGRPYGLEDLLSSMSDKILEELGQEVIYDLQFIRKWRNMVTHPQEFEVVVEKKDALQVVARAEMSIELFKNLLNPFS